ncbi:MAG: GAF domain-containing protein [Cytophagales bacterium]|nr:GAF domain-containing protein [Cytophagales bacterium]MDW8383601.1 GAF domain-containing protein [Flammeovirgaceae bacterium]
MLHQLNELEKELNSSLQLIEDIENNRIKDWHNYYEGESTRALKRMYQKMQILAEADRQRRWINEGLAKFLEILRKYQQNIEALCDNILSSLIKYVNANQGKLFLVNTSEKEPFLELVSTYAYSRKKYLRQRVELGEGLLGQAYLEKQTTIFSKLPPNYIRITSGLGDAPPQELAIVPFLYNDEVLGILEIASFEVFQPHHIEFLEKLGENVAAVIFNAKVHQRTEELLLISQQKTEELQAQEEEMRQTLEELHATQEELKRQAIEGERILKERVKSVQEKAYEKIGQMRQEIEQTKRELEETKKELDRVRAALTEAEEELNKLRIPFQKTA